VTEPLIVRGGAALEVGVPLSAALTVNVLAPGRVGVPLIRPEFGSSARPGGRAPAAMVHARGLTPKVALSVCEYGVPVVAAGSASVRIVIRSGATAIVPCPGTSAAIGVPLSLIVKLNMSVWQRAFRGEDVGRKASGSLEQPRIRVDAHP
jgi:hypothetical protein